MFLWRKKWVPQWLVAGLGNPGCAYAWTRHNLGWQAADALRDLVNPSARVRHRFNAQTYELELAPEQLASVLPHLPEHSEPVRVLLIKPTTMMNLSGRAVVRAKLAYPDARLLVICDDVNLAPGELRMRARGGAGGHKGLASVIGELGSSDFPRIRIGIGGSELADVTDYVLAEMGEDERAQARIWARQAAKKALEVVLLGFDAAASAGFD